MKIANAIALAVMGLSYAAFGSVNEGRAEDTIWTNPVSEEGQAIISNGDSWFYYVGSGDPGKAWKLGASHAGWKSGPTHIGYDAKGDPGFGTLFTTDPAPSSRYPVAYFRKPFDVPSGARDNDLRLSVDCDDGCVAYVNGTEVGRARLPAGEIKPYTAKLSGRNWAIFFVPKKLLKPRGNVVAVEVHQVAPGSSDMRFSAMLHTDIAVQPEPTVGLKADKDIVQLTADGKALTDWQLANVPVDFDDIGHLFAATDPSDICLASSIDRACHRLKSGETGVWTVAFNGATYNIRLQR